MKIAILGNDHTNTLGLVQSVGIEGHKPYAFMWGLRTGIVKSSRYLHTAITAPDVDTCIDSIIQEFKNDNEEILILCACDGAAIALERRQVEFPETFKFQHTVGKYSISQLQEKNLQVKIACKTGFNVPASQIVTSEKDVSYVSFEGPYIYKALKSIEGDKGDLTICEDSRVLRARISNTLKKTPRVLVQQYIERDYEISILGCALKNGESVIPAVEYKLTLFPKNVGLECLARMEPLQDENIKACISRLIKEIGYVGLFSVEMMHCKTDDKFYFTEINLRNDGANSFVRKFGFNLPLIHIRDLCSVPTIESNSKTLGAGYYIWEIHHLYSFLHRDMSFANWIKEIINAKGGLVFDKKDIRPFVRQFTFPILSKLKLIKTGNY